MTADLNPTQEPKKVYCHNCRLYITADLRAISWRFCQVKTTGKRQPFSVRVHIRTAVASPTCHRSPRDGGSHIEGPGCIQLYTVADQGYHPTGDDCKPHMSYYLKEQLAGRPTRILVDMGLALTLVRTDQWEHLDALTQASAER